MNPDTLKAAIEALKNEDGAAALAILQTMIVDEASGAEEAGEAGAGDAAGAGGDAGAMMGKDGAPPPPPAGDGKDKSGEDQTAVAAAATRLTRITAKTSLGEAVDEVEVWRQSHLTLEAEQKKIANERAQLEASERKKLYGELVTRAGRKPASVWSDDKATKAKPYLERMSIAELRQHVADESGAAPPRAPVQPPAGEGSGGDLTERELALCAKYKIKPEDYVAKRDGIQKASRTTAPAP